MGISDTKKDHYMTYLQVDLKDRCIRSLKSSIASIAQLALSFSRFYEVRECQSISSLNILSFFAEVLFLRIALSRQY